MNNKKISLFSKKMIRHILVSGLLEFGPVIVFLVSFEYLRPYEATILLMIATILSTLTTFQLHKRIPYVALYVATITIIFGYMTLHFHKIKFIQMRDTLYDTTAALTLIVGIMVNIPFLRIAFNQVVPMTDRAWNKLTYLWIGYFIVMALSNEVVRRLFSLSDWFTFKGWSVFLTAVFGITALYLSYEPAKSDNRSHEEKV